MNKYYLFKGRGLSFDDCGFVNDLPKLLVRKTSYYWGNTWWLHVPDIVEVVCSFKLDDEISEGYVIQMKTRDALKAICADMVGTEELVAICWSDSVFTPKQFSILQDEMSKGGDFAYDMPSGVKAMQVFKYNDECNKVRAYYMESNEGFFNTLLSDQCF